MKKRIWIFSLALVGLLVILATGCKKSSIVKATCQSESQCGGTYQACCTLTSCYYTFNGKTYNCDGTNCGTAATQLVSAMCGKKKAALDPSNSGIQEVLNLAKEMAANAKVNAGQ